MGALEHYSISFFSTFAEGGGGCTAVQRASVRCAEDLYLGFVVTSKARQWILYPPKNRDSLGNGRGSLLTGRYRSWQVAWICSHSALHILYFFTAVDPPIFFHPHVWDMCVCIHEVISGAVALGGFCVYNLLEGGRREYTYLVLLPAMAMVVLSFATFTVGGGGFTVG